MRDKNKKSGSANSDPVWKLLLMLLATGLVGAASLDIWSAIKAAAEFILAAGG